MAGEGGLGENGIGDETDTVVLDGNKTILIQIRNYSPTVIHGPFRYHRLVTRDLGRHLVGLLTSVNYS